MIRVGTMVSPYPYDHVIPGDRIHLDTKQLIRTEQSSIATVLSIHDGMATVFLSTIRPCAFRPSIPIDSSVVIGDRLVVWLNSDGSIRIVAHYPSSPVYDINCLRTAYETDPPITRQPLSFLSEKPLYTNLEVQDETHLDTFTIDPEQSLDFDDAISVDLSDPSHPIIYVHIVDMAHAALSPTEEYHLRHRCASLYLGTDSTIHLLDQDTACQRLSLITGQDRSVITVCMKMNETNVDSYQIYRSMIRVKRRYHYQQVQWMLTNEPNELGQPSEPLLSDIAYLSRLSKQRSSSIDYHLYLPSLVFTTVDGCIDSYHKQEDNESHQLIATCMILTNVVVSHHLSQHGVIFPNRFHDTIRGIPYTTRTGHSQVDSFIRVKTFAKAKYAIDEKGHFGLHLTEYVHFTSPMRRYADVMVHRVLSGIRYPVETLESEIEYINSQSTFTRSLQQLYQTWKIGRYVASLSTLQTIWVTGVSRAGVIWYLPEFSMNGFCHVSNLGKEYWKWDQHENTLLGTSSKQVITLGQSVLVHVRIDPLTFEPRIQLQ